MNTPSWEIEGTLARAEREAIIAALAHCGQSRSAAATRLGIGRSTLYRLVEVYKIDIPTRPPVAAKGRHCPSVNPEAGARCNGTGKHRSGQKIAEATDGADGSKVIFQEGMWLLVLASSRQPDVR